MKPYDIGIRRKVPYAVFRKEPVRLGQHAEHLQPFLALKFRFEDLLDDEELVLLHGYPGVIPEPLLCGTDDLWWMGEGEDVCNALEFEPVESLVPSLIRIVHNSKLDGGIQRNAVRVTVGVLHGYDRGVLHKVDVVDVLRRDGQSGRLAAEASQDSDTKWKRLRVSFHELLKRDALFVLCRLSLLMVFGPRRGGVCGGTSGAWFVLQFGEFGR